MKTQSVQEKALVSTDYQLSGNRYFKRNSPIKRSVVTASHSGFTAADRTL